MRFKKFNELIDFNADMHIHSTYTDGKDTISDIATQAEAINLHTIAITDHIREGSTYFNDYLNEIERIRMNAKINILVGFEARIKDFNGAVDVAKEIYTKADIKIASVHRFTIGKNIYTPDSFTKEISQDLELEISLAALSNNNKEFNVLGHPGGMSLKFFGEFPSEYFEEIIYACVKDNIAFELNSEYHKSVYPELRRILARYNPLVSLGSDAHNKQDIGKWGSLFKEEV